MQQLVEIIVPVAFLGGIAWWLVLLGLTGVFGKRVREAEKRGDEAAARYWIRRQMALSWAGRRWLRKYGLD